MNSLKLCMLGLVGVAAAVIVKQWKSDMLPFVRVASVVLFGIAAIEAASPLVTYLSSLLNQNGTAPYTAVLFKALGIALLTQLCAEICRECGESAAASGIELTGKIEILLLSLPLINEILLLAEELLDMGA